MHPIYEDEHLLVFEKPSGLLSVPGRGPDKQDCLSKRVQDTYSDALVVHRLDQDTSGLIVMARGIEAQRRISRLFETRQVSKRYIAVVAGNPLTSQAHVPTNEDGWRAIEGNILLDWERRPIHIIHPDGKPSLSLWRHAAGRRQRQLDRARALHRPHPPTACAYAKLGAPHAGRLAVCTTRDQSTDTALDAARTRHWISAPFH